MKQCLLTTAKPYITPYGLPCGAAQIRQRRGNCKVWIGYAFALFALTQVGCGGRSSATAPPIILSVSIADAVYTLSNDGSALLIAVIIVAPTETASFTISGLPAGMSATYKESESNPSGLLTLTAGPITPVGMYTPRVTVGSSDQTASTDFRLDIQAAQVKT